MTNSHPSYLSPDRRYIINVDITYKGCVFIMTQDKIAELIAMTFVGGGVLCTFLWLGYCIYDELIDWNKNRKK
jgi:hypothetical protein